MLYRVIQLSTGAVYCAKVYLNYGKEAGMYSNLGEYQTFDAINGEARHPNIMVYEDVIEFAHSSAPDEGLVALMMPFYPLSLADILDATGKTPLPFQFFLKVGYSLIFYYWAF